MNPAILHDKINEVVPIVGVSIGKPDDKTTWSMQYLSEPSAEQLAQIAQIIENYKILSVEEDYANKVALNFLTSSDWKVLRHADQKALQIPTSLTDEEYSQLLADRQAARNVIIKEG